MTSDSTSHKEPPRKHRRTRVAVRWLVTAVAVYVVAAYLIVPQVWRWHFRRHPALDDAPRITHTKAGIPGDPLNVALIATEEQLHKLLLAAGWYPADPITLRTSMRIAESTVFHRPYDDAPVSNLYLWGRREDFAFEQPQGNDARRRHHVRFWRSEEVDDQGRPLWLGAATFDAGVGVSHLTGQITHHIAADIDAERDKLLGDLQRTGGLAAVDWIDDFQSEHSGRNGGGDPWQTDGRLPVGLASDAPL